MGEWGGGEGEGEQLIGGAEGTHIYHLSSNSYLGVICGAPK